MLSSMRVIEAATYIAAPSAGVLLADWGADVVKIEPPEGCPMRATFKTEDDDFPVFNVDNRGKKGIVLDLAQSESHLVLKRLLKDADVFLTNVRSKSLHKMGLGYEQLKGEFPGLIYALVSGYGTVGPDKDLPGFDISAFFARSGLTSASTPRQEGPVLPRTAVGDHVTGIATAAAILAAVLNRQKTGQGCFIDSTLLRTGIYSLGTDFAVQLAYGKFRATKPRDQMVYPLGNYFCTKDGSWLTIIPRPADPKEWARLCEIVGAPELTTDPRYDTLRKRVAASSAIVGRLDECFAKKTLAEWKPLLEKADLIWAPVLRPDEVVEDEQANAIGAFIDLPSAAGVVKRSVGGPTRIVDAPLPEARAAPLLGEHTDEVMRQIGYSEDEITNLKKENIFG